MQSSFEILLFCTEGRHRNLDYGWYKEKIVCSRHMIPPSTTSTTSPTSLRILICRLCSTTLNCISKHQSKIAAGDVVTQTYSEASWEWESKRSNGVNIIWIFSVYMRMILSESLRRPLLQLHLQVRGIEKAPHRKGHHRNFRCHDLKSQVLARMAPLIQFQIYLNQRISMKSAATATVVLGPSECGRNSKLRHVKRFILYYYSPFLVHEHRKQYCR